jgi:hypothetical protein
LYNPIIETTRPAQRNRSHAGNEDDEMSDIEFVVSRITFD